jgi:hypothetical protein
MTTSDSDRRRLFEGAQGIPATEGNGIEILCDGVSLFARLCCTPPTRHRAPSTSVAA